MRTKLGSSGMSESKLVGFVKLRNLEIGQKISGTYRGSYVTKAKRPKVNYLIELNHELNFVTYDKETETEIPAMANAGDTISLETATLLAKAFENLPKGRVVEITYKGPAETAKPGQNPPYLVDVYDITDEVAPARVALGSSAPVAVASKATPKATSGFPFKKNA